MAGLTREGLAGLSGTVEHEVRSAERYGGSPVRLPLERLLRIVDGLHQAGIRLGENERVYPVAVAAVAKLTAAE